MEIYAYVSADRFSTLGENIFFASVMLVCDVGMRFPSSGRYFFGPWELWQ